MVTINNCIEFAAKALTLDQIANSIRDNSVILSNHDLSELEMLKNSAIAVVDEIGAEYMPITITQPAIYYTDLGALWFKDFDYTVLEVLLVTHSGRDIKFNRFNNRIEFNASFSNMGQEIPIMVTYKYAPKAGALNARIPWDNTQVGKRLIGFGICAEYCIRNGMTDEAMLWDRRYKDALFALQAPKRGYRVRVRRFK